MRRPWMALAAATLALGMMTIDVSIVRVALPTIQRELDASDVAQQWIVNGYLLTAGVFAIAGGRAGDLFGRRRIFLIGIVVFVGGSVASGAASSTPMLIAARAAQGVGAAIMTPGYMAIVTDAFAGRSLGRALGILTGVGTAGVSVGLLLGGLLIDVANWRWIFFINVLVSLLVIGLVLGAVPERRDTEAKSMDLAGLGTLAVGLSALTLALMEAPVWGWGSTATLGLLVASIVVLAGWVGIERRAAQPLVDPAVLSGPMLGATFVAFCLPFVFTGLAVLLAIYLQSVLRYSALETGALLLPMAIPLVAGALLTGRLLARLGARPLVVGGMLGIAAGAFAVGAGAGTSGDYVALVPGLIVFGFGTAVALPAMTTVIMASAGEGSRGMVSGVYNTARLVGSALGLAVMGSLLATIESAKLTSEQAAGRLGAVEAGHIHSLLAGGKEGSAALAGLSAESAKEVEQDAGVVFDTAFATTMKLSAIVAVLGAVVAARVIPGLRSPAAHVRG